VPSSGWPPRGPQSSGAGAFVTMYFGIEIPMRFSPLSIGAGVGPKEATNIGRFAASALTKFIQSASEAKTFFSFNPTNHEIVDA